MIISSTRARVAFAGRRLDAQYFCSPATRASETLLLLRASGVPMRPISGENGLGSVFHPNRFKRQLAASAEEAAPFLRAFDVFEYLPQPADWISILRTRDVDTLRVTKGTILLTRSGRNLGPAVMTDVHIAKFIPSDDLLRIRVEDEQLRHYLLAFLNSPTGQSLLRQDKTGSVIDHLSSEQVGRQLVPIFVEEIGYIADRIRRAVQLREAARRSLSDAVERIEPGLTAPSSNPVSNGWTVRASALTSRIDAAYYRKDVAWLRRSLRRLGGVPIADVATAHKPGGRYKTYYIEPEHGRPLLSGRNLLQVHPVGLKHIADRSIPADAGYELESGWICFQADGRAEERLGFPVMIAPDRNGWLASGHVARIIPIDKEDAGWIWAAMATGAVQAQMSSIACGSVVDALYEADIGRIMLPPSSDEASSAEIVAAWRLFAEAGTLEAEAIERLEASLNSATP